jgi:hypothetical protein
MDPESQVREVLLKDKFLTQSAPDIRNRRVKDKRHHGLIAALREGPT